MTDADTEAQTFQRELLSLKIYNPLNFESPTATAFTDAENVSFILSEFSQINEDIAFIPGFQNVSSHLII